MTKPQAFNLYKLILVSFLLLFSLTGFSRQLGDVDNDGQLSATDLLWIQQFALGLRTFTPEEQAVADVGPFNAPDGQITAADILVLERALGGDITLPTLPDAPTISELPSSTNDNPLEIAGTAAAGNEVRLYVNGELIYSKIIGGSAYSLKAILTDGVNSISVTQWDGVHESVAVTGLVSYG